MLLFQDVAPATNSLKSLGTVAENCGIDGYFQLASVKNFKSEKKVTIALFNGKGQRTFVPCSKQVSDDLKASKDADDLAGKLYDLGSYPIYESAILDENGEAVMETDEKGNPVLDEKGNAVPLIIRSIGYPAGTDMSSTKTVVTAELLKVKAEPKTISFEDLLSL